MNSLYHRVIDYNLIKSYRIEKLIDNIVLPIKKYDFYTEVAVCKESKTSFLDENSIKKTDSTKELIHFFLDDFEIKYDLYNLIHKKYNDSLELFFNKLIKFAIYKQASDIHFESLADSFSIRLRIHGELKTYFIYEKELFTTLSIFIKLISKLDITQNRLPQNGRFTLDIKKEKLDFRLSTMPTLLGESIVIRLLNQSNVKKSFDEIGFSKNNIKIVEKSIKSNSGLILVTGPTGSGKTTTLYTMINALNTNNKKIITIEDPVEYQIKGVQQIAINNEINLSFQKILKDVLRQDPDVILIGEIRDEISLSIALQASLTGHLVLSTLHTTDCISTIHRLFDLQAKPYLVSNTLKTVISQRLVLQRCKCIEGCSICNYTKFDGRVMISEVLNIDEKLSELILQTSSYSKILEYLKTIDFKTMKEDAQEKIALNITTNEEVLKIIV